MKKKMTRSERSSLWVSRVVIWITIVVVLFPALWMQQRQYKIVFARL